MRKKIAIVLAAGVAFGTMFAAPAAVPVAVAAESNVTNRTSAAAYAEQGDKLFTEGKYVEAAEACEKAAELAQNNEEYWTSAGFCYFKAERWDKSAICYKNAIKINPNNGLAHFYCGMAYYHQVEVPHQLSTRTIYERAAKFGDRAAELLPDDVSVRMAAGLIQESLAMYVGSGREKHLDKAYKNYCKAVDLDPNNASNVGTLSRFVQSWSRYGFQPYTPATQKTDVTGPRSNTPIDPAPGVDRQPGTQTQPGGNVDVTGATNAPRPVSAPSGSLDNVMDNFEYEVLDSGMVRFTGRCSDSNNYIFTKPEQFSSHPGKYMLGWLNHGTWMITYHNMGDAFDYDPQTQTFIWYRYNPMDGKDYNDYRMRFVDKNTVYIECFDEKGQLYAARIYGYMPYTAAPAEIRQSNAIAVSYKGVGTAEFDENQCVWWSNGGGLYPDGKPIDEDVRDGSIRSSDSLNVLVDMARAFLAVNGNIGALSEEYEIEENLYVKVNL